jgi:hypothetical protein
MPGKNKQADRAIAQALISGPPIAEVRVRSLPIPVVARFTAWDCGRSLVWIASSNPAWTIKTKKQVRDKSKIISHAASCGICIGHKEVLRQVLSRVFQPFPLRNFPPLLTLYFICVFQSCVSLMTT